MSLSGFRCILYHAVIAAHINIRSLQVAMNSSIFKKLVMFSQRNVKESKRTLTRYRARIIASTIVYSIILLIIFILLNFLVYYLSLSSLIVNLLIIFELLFIIMPIRLGRSLYALNIIKGNIFSTSQIFTPFKIELLNSYVLIFLEVQCVRVLSSLPLAAGGLLLLTLPLNIFGIILVTIGVYIVTLQLSGLSQVYFIIAHNPLMKSRSVIKHSFELMKGFHLRWLAMAVTFIGWWILDIITLGFSGIWSRPLWDISTARFHFKIMKYRKRSAQIKSNQPNK